MPAGWITGLFVVFCAFCAIYGAYLGLNKAVDWMINKLFYSGGD